jgi:hypothetical protein
MQNQIIFSFSLRLGECALFGLNARRMPIAPSDLSQVAATRKETRFLLYGGRGSKLGSSPRSNPGKYGHPKKETTFLDEMVKATRINQTTASAEQDNLKREQCQLGLQSLFGSFVFQLTANSFGQQM